MSKNYIQRSQTITLPNGSKKRLKAYGNTEREAIKKLAKLVAEYEAGKIFITKATPFENYAADYLDTYKQPQVSAGTLKNDERRLKLYIYPNIGQISLDKITTGAVQQCLNAMQEADLSQDYIKKTYNLVFNILEQARKDRLTLYNMAENCTLPKGKAAKHRRALTDEERTLFLNACAQFDKGVVYLVSYYCGLRPAEVRALRWCNLDFKAHTLTITNRVDDKGNLLPPKSKAGFRTVPIPDKLYARLIKLPRNIDPEAFVFGNGTQPITKQNYQRGWNYVVRLMNIAAGAEMYRNAIITPAIDEELSPYYLRHTYCTILAETGVPLKTAQYLMGHSSVELTANIYTHITPKLLEEATPLLQSI